MIPGVVDVVHVVDHVNDVPANNVRHQSKEIILVYIYMIPRCQLQWWWRQW